MTEKRNLTQGSISEKLIKLALPIMATSFVQMAYSIIDMVWVGKLGAGAVASVGTAGFFTWFAFAFIIIPKIAAEVGVSQSIGKGDMAEGRIYIRHSIQLIILLATFYSLSLIVFRGKLVSFFNLGNLKIEGDTENYLLIIGLGIIFYFINPVFSGIFNGSGDSRTPFLINSIGLLTNMILDPILIFGLGPVPKLGVSGAALATIISQALVTLVFVRKTKKFQELFQGINILEDLDKDYTKRIFKLGFPPAFQEGFMALASMVLARIIARWGTDPIAVQKIGSQIESISWMTVGGFETAMATFTGQNYGAGKEKRIKKGYFTGLFLVSLIGFLATLLFIFAARPIFSIFLKEEAAVKLGVNYLRILSFSQIFMCAEIATKGAFNGLGKTIPPSLIGVFFNGLRIPLALFLSSTSLGLNGIWLTISLTSVFKGTILSFWYIFTLRKAKLA